MKSNLRCLTLDFIMLSRLVGILAIFDTMLRQCGVELMLLTEYDLSELYILKTGQEQSKK